MLRGKNLSIQPTVKDLWIIITFLSAKVEATVTVSVIVLN